jgi:membrane-associated phospholipid phosphatase
MNVPKAVIAIMLVGSALVWLFYGPIDLAAIRWSEAHQGTWIKPVSAFITEFGVITGWLVGSMLLWFYLRYAAKKRAWADRVRFFFASVAVTGLAVIPLKLLFGKARPSKLFDENLYGFQWFAPANAYGLHGFPSGHTTTAFAVATALALIFPRLAVPLYGGALLVGLSRIGVLYHYPSDVVAGAMLGTVLTLLLYNFDRISFQKKV